MNKYLKYNVVCLLGASLLAGSGCKKILEPDPKALTVDVLYSDFPGSMAGINAIYSPLTSLYRGGNSAGDWLQIDEASDDVMDNPLGVGNLPNAIDYFTLAADNGTTFNIWDGFYRIIYRANVAIDRLAPITFPARLAANTATGLSFKDQFIGEAKFLRAFSYFNLVRAFGGVPIHVKEIKAASEVNKPRASVEAVYAQIEADLADAIAKLPGTGFGSGAAGNERGRANKWSAMALLADVYLTQKKYDLAKSTALAVINNNGGKALNDNYVDNFPARNVANSTTTLGSENTKESLFEIQFTSNNSLPTANVPTANNFSAAMGPAGIIASPTQGGGGLQGYRPTDANPNNPFKESTLTSGILQQYAAGDLRKDVNFSNAGNFNGVPIPLTHKYYENRGVAGNGNFPVYRLAEMYLIYAEATNEATGPDGTSIEYVNKIRRRAFGLPFNTPNASVDLISSIGKTAFQEEIRQERRRELAMENKRWFDLVRYGFDYAKDALVTKQGRDLFNQNKMLFPIAAIEFVNNPNLGSQNPGY
jgi:hypothetical protein